MKLEINQKTLNIAIIGKPNSGKSSLLNKIMNDMISIISEKPHSTREPVLAVYNHNEYQLVFVDTPGVNDSTKSDFQLLTSKALSCLQDCDCGLFLIDATKPIPNYILELAKNNHNKLNIAVITKIDLVNKGKLLPMTKKLSEVFPNIFSLSLDKTHDHKINYVLDFLMNNSVEKSWEFSNLFVTTKSDVSKMKDRIQEILFKFLHKEIPYNLDIELTHEIKNKTYFIYIIIRGIAKYKPILLGKIHNIGPEVRKNLQKQLGKKVNSFITYKIQK